MPKTVHLIGNAHLDPVWLWRFQDGFSEIKATFRSALDRIAGFDGFIFTSACISYYKWVEENCPEMFKEIKTAVKNGRWCITGAMWVQPDCNIPSAESFARHMLYSQRYVREKFGVSVKTGYNVDSFGHNASMPKLLRAGGMENYVYMRPGEGAEKKYPFDSHTFLWKCSEGSEVLAFRIHDPYCINMNDDRQLCEYDALTDASPCDFMMFYGVGNHGGGPTVTNIRQILEYMPKASNTFKFSDPDMYFDDIRKNFSGELPVYEGELQNHASGCYSANARVKKMNRDAENRLNEGERLDALAAYKMGFLSDVKRTAQAWQSVLFNQFHDVLCGCSVRAAYDDAFADFSSAISYAVRLANAAAQRISWAVDTSKGVEVLSKECGGAIWEADNLGTPVVVFNPTSHSVSVPVRVHQPNAAGVSDENDAPVPFQRIRADYTNGSGDIYSTLFMAKLPPYGWRTYWVYRAKTLAAVEALPLYADESTLENDCVKVVFDRETGAISSYTLKASGEEIVGKSAGKAVVIDDSENDTWAHNHFYFDKVVGEFGSPEFEVLERGGCTASLKVTAYYKNSKLEQTYSLYINDERIHVNARLTLNEPFVMVKMSFDSGVDGAKMLREIPAGAIVSDADGREEPMQRYFASISPDGKKGLAVINDCKYSASADGSEIRFVAARSCNYADHYGIRDGRGEPQDIGETSFRYVIMPYSGDNTSLENAAEELNTQFSAMTVTETYHKGCLPQRYSACESTSRDISISAVKRAEDGQGFIVRFIETAGRESSAEVTVFGVKFTVAMKPYAIKSFRIDGGAAVECDFTESAVD